MDFLASVNQRGSLLNRFCDGVGNDEVDNRCWFKPAAKIIVTTGSLYKLVVIIMKNKKEAGQAHWSSPYVVLEAIKLGSTTLPSRELGE